MALARQDALNLITQGIAWLATLCKLRGIIHLFDSNTIAHDFFARLLNEIHGLNLLVLDRIQANFPAIDLGDEGGKRAFQITAEKGGDKIQATLDKYIKHNLVGKYGKIQVIVIGEKQATYSALNVPAGLPFVPEDDIIDTAGLIKLIEGLETERLERIARVVQAEIRFAAFPSDLYLHTTVNNSPRDYWPGGDDTRLAYVASQSAGVITIRSYLPYLEKVKAGGPIEPVRYINATYCPFEWDFPALDFRLLNRTPVPFLLVEAVFDVEESYLDTTPVIAVQEDVQQSFAGYFWLVNEGATVLENLTVRYQMIPSKVPVPSAFPDSLPFAESIGTLDTSAQVVVEGAFQSCGVDLDRLVTLMNVVDGDRDTVLIRDEAGAESLLSRQDYDAAIKACLGPFQDEIGTVIGEIGFDDPSSQAKQRRVVRFRSPVHIFNQNRRGLPMPPSFVYHVELDIDRKNYQKRISVSQGLDPGESDRFLIKVGVDKSSVHRFRVTFLDAGGQTIQSLPIQLHCFRPRTRRGSVKAEQAHGEDKARWSAALA